MLTEAQKRVVHLLLQHAPLEGAEAAAHHFALTYAELEPVLFDPRTVPVHVVGAAVVAAPERGLLVRFDAGLGRWRPPWGHAPQHQDAAVAALEAAREAWPGATLRLARPQRIWDVGLWDIPALGDVRAHRHLVLAFVVEVLGDATAPAAPFVLAPVTDLAHRLGTEPGTRWTQKLSRG